MKNYSTSRVISIIGVIIVGDTDFPTKTFFPISFFLYLSLSFSIVAFLERGTKIIFPFGPETPKAISLDFKYLQPVKER